LHFFRFKLIANKFFLFFEKKVKLKNKKPKWKTEDRESEENQMGDIGKAKAGRRKVDYLMKFNGEIDKDREVAIEWWSRWSENHRI